MRMKYELKMAEKGKIIENIMPNQIFFSSFKHEFKHFVVSFDFYTS